MYIVICQYTTCECARMMGVYNNRDEFEEDENMQKLLDNNSITIDETVVEVDRIVNLTGKPLGITNQMI